MLDNEWQDTTSVAGGMFGTGWPTWWMKNIANAALNRLADDGTVEKLAAPNRSRWRARAA